MSDFNIMGVYMLHYANDLDAFIPEQWAMESVAILQENMVAANLVHRDFEFMFARMGDTVNTRQPAEFTAKRKLNSTVDIQDASATNIPVKLDHHVHVSFLIGDGDESKSFMSLVNEYMRPAVLSMARYVDQVVLGTVPQFISNQAGSLGGLSSSNAVQYITETGLVMDQNKAHQVGRNQIWTPNAHAQIIQNATFHEADKVGDDGSALRMASLGQKLNFFHWMAQNMSQVSDTVTAEETGAIDLGAGYPAGTTSIHVDGITPTTGTVTAGQWISIGGKVYQVATGDTADASGDVDITLTYGLKEAVADNDVVSIFNQGNLITAGYAAGYMGYINVDDGSAGAPDALQVGQTVSLGLNNYTVIEVIDGAGSTKDVLLDRALDAAVSDNDPLFYGPAGGGMNLAFHKNAITLAVRPLAPPRQGTGAISSVVNLAGVPMRVVITYDGDKQGHLVTLDFLAGVKVLDPALGAVCLS